MSLPRGYKATEVGVIPEDWNCADLGRFTLKVGSGKTPTGGNTRYKSNGRPFVRSQNVGRGHLVLDDLIYIDEATHAEFPATELELDDVLLNITGASIGRSALADQKVLGGNVNQHVCIIRPKSKELKSKFLCSFLLSAAGQSQIDSFQAGGTREGLNFKQVRAFSVPIPPTLTEQSAIAEALSDVDEAIASGEAVIAKKRALKTATMQALLSGTRRLPGFLGEWEVKALDKICPMQRGFDLPTSQIRAGNVPVVYSNGVSAFHEKAMVKGPGIVTGRSGTIGNVHFVEQDFWPHNTALWVTSFCGNDPKFLLYFLRKLDLSQFASGSGVPTLNRNDFHSFKVKIPEPDEQIAIAAVLSEMDYDLAWSQSKLTKLHRLKTGITQQLLTGKIRLL